MQNQELVAALRLHATFDLEYSVILQRAASLILRQAELLALKAKDQPQCEDEGCDHYGTPHAHIDKSTPSQRLIVCGIHQRAMLHNLKTDSWECGFCQQDHDARHDENMRYVPREPEGTQLFAVSPSRNEWYYINHANTWQTMPNPTTTK